MMHVLVRGGLAATLFLPLVACGPSLLQRGTAQLAAVTADGARALASTADDSAALCRRQERVSYLRSRIDARWKSTPTPESSYLKWSRRELSSREPDPERPCTARLRDRDVVLGTLAILEGYGAAMKALAEGTTYQGGELGTATRLLGEIAKRNEAPAALSGALGKLGEPLRDLVNWGLRHHTENEVRKKVVESQETVNTVIELLEIYIRLNDEKLAEVRTTWVGTLDALEERLGLPAGSTRGLEAVTFYELAARQYDELTEQAERNRSALERIAAIRASFQALAKLAGARQRAAGKEALQKMFDYAGSFTSLIPVRSKQP